MEYNWRKIILTYAPLASKEWGWQAHPKDYTKPSLDFFVDAGRQPLRLLAWAGIRSTVASEAYSSSL
jgi:hypothetical protein